MQINVTGLWVECADYMWIENALFWRMYLVDGSQTSDRS